MEPESVPPNGHRSSLTRTRPPGLYGMTGMYTVTLSCHREIEAESPHAAIAILDEELRERTSDGRIDDFVEQAQAISISIDCVINEPLWQEGPIRRPYEESPLHFRSGLDGRAAATPTLRLPQGQGESTPEPPQLPTGPEIQDAESGAGLFAITFFVEGWCAREVWAKDEQHAERLLAEDVEALLTPETLDDWRDEVTYVNWDLAIVEKRNSTKGT